MNISKLLIQEGVMVLCEAGYYRLFFSSSKIGILALSLLSAADRFAHNTKRSWKKISTPLLFASILHFGYPFTWKVSILAALIFIPFQYVLEKKLVHAYKVKFMRSFVADRRLADPLAQFFALVFLSKGRVAPFVPNFFPAAALQAIALSILIRMAPFFLVPLYRFYKFNSIQAFYHYLKLPFYSQEERFARLDELYYGRG